MDGSPKDTAGIQKSQLHCPLCGGERFRKKVIRMDSKWSMSSDFMTRLACEKCDYILLFANEQEIAWKYVEVKG